MLLLLLLLLYIAKLVASLIELQSFSPVILTL
jgi:hypothetical protein